MCARFRAEFVARRRNTGRPARPKRRPPELKNWIEIGIGGVITDGDRAQFEQEHHRPGDEVFGGIQDLHYEQTIGKDVQLTLDGHAIFDTNDYGIVLELSKPKLGYIRFGYDEFRTWYDGNAGYFRPNGEFFPPPFPEMHIDRGEAWVELGLRVPDWPEITLRYSHEFRDGQKDSTMWGDTTLTGIPGATRKIAPAFRDIDETRDIFSLEASKTFGNTDVLLGMRYEHTNDDDTLNMIRGAGQLPPAVRASRCSSVSRFSGSRMMWICSAATPSLKLESPIRSGSPPVIPTPR